MPSEMHTIPAGTKTPPHGGFFMGDSKQNPTEKRCPSQSSHQIDFLAHPFGGQKGIAKREMWSFLQRLKR
jgi:hypothetical protein